MSRDLNPQIASYVKNNQATSDSKFTNNVCDNLNDIRDGIGDGWINDKNLFEFENDNEKISQKEFRKIIADATGSSSYDKEADSLFNILNSEKDENGKLDFYLTKSEVEAIMADKSKIDTFSLWDALNSFTEDSVNYEISHKSDLDAIKNGYTSWDILEELKGEEYVKALKKEAGEKGINSTISDETVSDIWDLFKAEAGSHSNDLQGFFDDFLSYHFSTLNQTQIDTLTTNFEDFKKSMNTGKSSDGET